MAADTASSRQAVATLMKKVKRRPARKFAAIFGAAVYLLLQKTRTEHVQETSTGLKAMQNCAAREAHLFQETSILFREHTVSLIFSSASTVSQSSLAKTKTSAKTSLLQSVLTATEPLLLSHSISHVKCCLQNRGSSVTLH